MDRAAEDGIFYKDEVPRIGVRDLKLASHSAATQANCTRVRRKGRCHKILPPVFKINNSTGLLKYILKNPFIRPPAIVGYFKAFL
jgi:hypothetical protein